MLLRDFLWCFLSAFGVFSFFLSFFSSFLFFSLSTVQSSEEEEEEEEEEEGEEGGDLLRLLSESLSTVTDTTCSRGCLDAELIVADRI